MKKTVSILFTILMIVTLNACSASKENDKSVFDQIKESSVAKMESSEGVKVYVWNMQDIASLSSLQIEEAPLEPADKEEDWLYRITYNPKDKVSNGEEIIVSFHSAYIQIDSEFYLAKQGVGFDGILEWAESKLEYLVKEYGTELQISVSYYISVDEMNHLHLFSYNKGNRWPGVISVGMQQVLPRDKQPAIPLLSEFG